MIQFVRNLFRSSTLVEGVIRVVPETDDCPPTRFWVDARDPFTAMTAKDIPRVGDKFEVSNVKATELDHQPGRFEVQVNYRKAGG